MSAPSSPCRRLCVLDPETRLCTGCGRTLAEIADWGSMDEAERRRIMAALPSRLAAFEAAAAEAAAAEAAGERPSR